MTKTSDKTMPTQPETTAETPMQRQIREQMDSDLSRVGQVPERPAAPIKTRRMDTKAVIIPAEWIEVDPDQVRKQAKSKDAKEIQDLALSIQEQGLRNPIEVREIVPNERYRIVAGEGRFIACTEILGWDTIRATLVDATDDQILWLQLHENIHRRELHPLDLAKAIQSSIDGGLKLSEVAAKLCKGEAYVQKALTVARDLSPAAEEVLKTTEKGKSLETAYEIATVDEEQQEDIARQVAEENLTQKQLRERTSTAKKQGDSHRSGRTGRKTAKQPYSRKFKHAPSGITITMTARKKNVAIADEIEAVTKFLDSLKSNTKRRKAA